MKKYIPDPDMMKRIAELEALLREMSDLNAGDSHAKWIRIRNKVREYLKGGDA